MKKIALTELSGIVFLRSHDTFMNIQAQIKFLDTAGQFDD